jgi:hypothetical protein
MERRRLQRCCAKEYRELRETTPKGVKENGNHLLIVLDRCINVEAGKMFDCQEIAKPGCDHDLAGYPHVEPLVNAGFRRPFKLAKGDSCCEFNFYRAGFAPNGPYENK